MKIHIGTHSLQCKQFDDLLIDLNIFSGCDSFLYSCCQPPDIARKDKVAPAFLLFIMVLHHYEYHHHDISTIIITIIMINQDVFEARKQDFTEHEPECGVSRHRYLVLTNK